MHERGRAGFSKLGRGHLADDFYDTGEWRIYDEMHVGGIRGMDIIPFIRRSLGDIFGDGLSRETSGINVKHVGRGQAVISLSPARHAQFKELYALHNSTPEIEEAPNEPSRLTVLPEIKVGGKTRPHTTARYEIVQTKSNEDTPDAVFVYGSEASFLSGVAALAAIDGVFDASPVRGNRLMAAMRGTEDASQAYENAAPRAVERRKILQDRREFSINRMSGYFNERGAGKDVNDEIDAEAKNLVEINGALGAEDARYAAFESVYTHLRKPRSVGLLHLLLPEALDYLIVPQASGFVSSYLGKAVESSVDNKRSVERSPISMEIRTNGQMDTDSFVKRVGPKLNRLGNALNLDVTLARHVVA